LWLASPTDLSHGASAIGQLKIADSGTASEDRGYAYDAAWNLNYRTNNTTLNQFKVDPKNQLTNAFSAPYSYDGNGNMTWGNSARNYYVYDDENRLVQWFNYYSPNGSPLRSGDLRTDFVYDGLGRLRSRTEYTWTGSSWYPGGTTTYVYDGMRVIQERVGGSPQASYTRGSDLSGSLEGAGGIGGLLARSTGNWTNHNYYHADGNGNITYLVNSSQTLAASYRYDPYGNTISSSGSLAGANVYRFSSKLYDANSGLYYYGYRWYAPNLQRWLNRDPLGEDERINLYTYAGNNPINFVDPFGFTALPLHPWPHLQRLRFPTLREIIQNATFLGGRCCNKSGRGEYALVDGLWRYLEPGECTGRFEDCDGMTCKSGFYAVYQVNGNCTDQQDTCPFNTRRWTPNGKDRDAKSPTDRGSHQGDTPPHYPYHYPTLPGR
jgi:RHS repeat-associated protein